MIVNRKAVSVLSSAVRPAIEVLENRQLLSAALTVSSSLMVFNAVKNSSASQTETLTLTDSGDATLTLGPTAFTLADDTSNATNDVARFTLVNASSAPATLTPGQSFGLQLTYSANNIVTNSALLNISTNDATTPTHTVTLHGIGTKGLGGTNQPSLATILRAYEIPTIVGEGPNDANAMTDTTYPEPPDASSQEVDLQRLQKAGTGPVTITTLASFTAAGTEPYTLGTYTPGIAGSLNQLFFTPTAEYQSTYVQPQGSTTFDPGASQFGFYFVSNTQVRGRIGYSEDALNTFDTTDPRKFRFFPMETPNGTVVPNTYIMTSTEWSNPTGYDFTNIVAIVSNVEAATGAPNGPVLGLQNQNAVAGSNTIVFNRITSPNATLGDVVHDTSVLTINNTGGAPLIVTSYALTANWTLVSPPSFPLTVAAGASQNLTLKFTGDYEPSVPYNETDSAMYPSGGGMFYGTLTLHSNDPNNPTAVENLKGWRQYHSENENEPSVQTIVNLLFGWGTNINSTPIPTLAENQTNSSSTVPTYYGEETVSAYWQEADPSLLVNVQQIAAYHTEGNSSTTYWYPQGSSSRNQILSLATDDGQTLFPDAINTTTPAAGSFSTTGVFGFDDDGEYSDDSKNNVKTGGGHHVRFFPVRDAVGNLIPNTYIMTMDYSATTNQNFDFQDNMYLVTNIRPAAVPPAPTDLNATMSSGGNVLQWAPVVGTTLAGYNVYSASSLTGTYALLTATPITALTYTDSTASTSAPTYYKVTAVAQTGAVESLGDLADAILPVAPTGASGGGGLALPGSPVAANETASTKAGTAVTINEFADATDNASGTLLPASVVVTTAPTGGTTAVNTTTGNITYTPNTGFTGTDTFQYTVSDNTGATSSPATITVNVTALPIGDPIAANLSVASNEGAAISINVAASATDSGTAVVIPSSVIITQNPLQGTAVVNATTGVITYIPTAGYAGVDTFQYTIADTLSAVSGAGTVTISVTAAIPPVPPAAFDFTGSTTVNGATTLNVLSTAFDPASTLEPSLVAISTAPAHGTAAIDATTGAITYTPTTGYVGSDTLQYTVGDALGAISPPATISVDVGVEINATTAKSLSFVDANGSTVTLALTGGGSAEVFFNGTGTQSTIPGPRGTGTVSVAGTGLSISSIDATGTGVASSLVVSRKGTAATTIGAISVTGPLGKITAPTATLAGNLSVSGGLGTVQFAAISNSDITVGSSPAIASGFTLTTGHVTDASVTSAIAIKLIKVLDWTESGTRSTIIAPSIASLISTGNFQAGLTLSGAAPYSLRTAVIGGQIATNGWSIAGNTNSVTVGSVAAGWSGTFAQTINAFTVKINGFTGALTAGTLRAAKIGGNLTGATVTLTNGVAGRAQSLGRLTVTGAITDSKVLSAGNIGSISSAGITSSSIEAGTATGVALPDSAADIVSAASIASVAVTGKAAAFSNSNIGASAISSLRLGIIDNSNNGSGFGVGAAAINSVTGVLETGGAVSLNKASLVSADTIDAYATLHKLNLGDFVIHPGL